MAEVTVKLFGVFRSDTHLAKETVNVNAVSDIFPSLNAAAEKAYLENKKENPSLEKPAPIEFKDAVVYINGERVSKKSRKLSNGDEVWLMSPASGG